MLTRLQRRFLYFADRGFVAGPADYGFAHEDVSLTAEDGTKLHAWWLPVEGATRTALFLHGNAGVELRGGHNDAFTVSRNAYVAALGEFEKELEKGGPVSRGFAGCGIARRAKNGSPRGRSLHRRRDGILT